MNRVHDMGGRFGDGPIRREADPEPVFKEDWQARALALTLAAGSLGRALRHASDLALVYTRRKRSSCR